MSVRSGAFDFYEKSFNQSTSYFGHLWYLKVNHNKSERMRNAQTILSSKKNLLPTYSFIKVRSNFNLLCPGETRRKDVTTTRQCVWNNCEIFRSQTIYWFIERGGDRISNEEMRKVEVPEYYLPNLINELLKRIERACDGLSVELFFGVGGYFWNIVPEGW